jgi:glucan phosphoethanolaminetransferase (alkaline phosphatase superfamily)
LKSERGSSKRNKLPLIAGSFAIIAACICAFLGIAFVRGAIRYPSYLVSPFTLSVAALGFLGFFSGLSAGILISKEKISRLTAVGMVLMLPEGFMVTIMGGWFFGLPLLFLSILGMILVVSVSRKEFTLKFRIILICSVLIVAGIVSFYYLNITRGGHSYPKVKDEYLINVPSDQWTRDTAGYYVKAIRELNDNDLQVLEQHGVYVLQPTDDSMIYCGLIVEEEVTNIEALPFVVDVYLPPIS